MGTAPGLVKLPSKDLMQAVNLDFFWQRLLTETEDSSGSLNGIKPDIVGLFVDFLMQPRDEGLPLAVIEAAMKDAVL